MPIVYATFQDMTARLDEADIIQLANVAEIADAQPFVEERLRAAGVIIDGYVSAKYGDRSALPVPPLLNQLACDIAIYRMYRREVPDKVKDDYSEAVRTLRDIAAGKVKIDEGVIDAQPTRPGAVLIEGTAPIFGRKNMDGY